MDLGLSEEQLAIKRAAREFALKEIRPHVPEWAAEKRFPREIVKKMGDLGFFGCCFPKKYGGTETGFVTFALIVEEMAWGDPLLCSLLNTQGMSVPYTILNWGNDEQIERYVPKLISGEWLGFFSLTESGSGADAAGSMKSLAVLEGEDWVINGSKMFVGLGDVADCGLLFVKTDPTQGYKGISAFIAETHRPGYEPRRIKMTAFGEWLPVCEVSLNDYRLPRQNLLHEVGGGFLVAMNALDYGRLTVSARAVGLAQAMADKAIEYCNEREAFGQKIGAFQMVKRLIAEMVVDIEAARMLVYNSAYLKDKGEASTRESAIAKYFAGEACARVAQAAVEIFGGYAVCDEYPISRWANAAMVMRTGEGPSNVLRIMIADDALGWRIANRHSVKRRFP